MGIYSHVPPDQWSGWSFEPGYNLVILVGKLRENPTIEYVGDKIQTWVSFLVVPNKFHWQKKADPPFVIKIMFRGNYCEEVADFMTTGNPMIIEGALRNTKTGGLYMECTHYAQFLGRRFLNYEGARWRRRMKKLEERKRGKDTSS